MYFNSSDFSNFRIGGGAAGTTLSLGALVLTLAAIALIFLLPKKYIIVPLIVGWIITPYGQQLYIAGAHLFIGRLLTLFAWARLLFDQGTTRLVAAGNLGALDKCMIVWGVCRSVATCLLFMSAQAIITQTGYLIDTVASFFLLRVLIRTEEDVIRTLRVLAVVVWILAMGMTIENVRNLNVFGYLGSRIVPELREGRIRAQGPFLGPIPAGTFGATLLCMFIWLWRSGKSSVIGGLAVVGALIMVITSASSTPIMTTGAVVIAIMMWPLRRQMRMVRWGLVAFLIGLQLMMKAPVWWAINHVDLVGGNSSYHRAMIIEQFVFHFREWWLLGVASAAAWGWDVWDGANQFVAEGESGGLATFICFLLLITRVFSQAGRARKRVAGQSNSEWLFWLLGGTLFSFVVSFFGICFSDQSINAWLIFLAITAVLTSSLPLAHRIVTGAPIVEEAAADRALTTLGARDTGSWDHWRTT